MSIGFPGSTSSPALNYGPYAGAPKNASGGLMAGAFGTPQTMQAASGVTGPNQLAGRINVPYPKMIMYSNTVPAGIPNITYVSATEQQITFDDAYSSAPYAAGDQIIISGVNAFFDGVFEVKFVSQFRNL